MKQPVPPLPQLGQAGLAVQPHVSQFNELHLHVAIIFYRLFYVDLLIGWS